MKNCNKCHKTGIREAERYCPDCGSRELAEAAAVPSTGTTGTSVQAAPKGIRVAAFGVDFAGLFILSLLTNIPGLGLIAALAALLYQLMRDYKGASLGKVIFHLTVISRSGQKATTRQCLIRNVVFATPYLAMFFPGLGFLAGGAFIICLYLVELLLVLTSGQRIGDRMAGTLVVKRS